jgi:hypothetical protein
VQIAELKGETDDLKAQLCELREELVYVSKDFEDEKVGISLKVSRVKLGDQGRSTDVRPKKVLRSFTHCQSR